MATKDLIELFYDIYNPAPTGTQKTVIDEGAYSVPIVEPALEVPTPAPPQANVAGASDAPLSQLPPQNAAIAPLPMQPPAQQNALKDLEDAASAARQLTRQSPTADTGQPNNQRNDNS